MILGDYAEHVSPLESGSVVRGVLARENKNYFRERGSDWSNWKNRRPPGLNPYKTGRSLEQFQK
jgi:hypothetical protein